mmetsp:Transcript_27087/g.84601  ORF Transcript_27087/g.84601 Transcript_27087/m.84601 type:complete len:211 (+) Transcript_27087:434-1066(+)
MAALGLQDDVVVAARHSSKRALHTLNVLHSLHNLLARRHLVLAGRGVLLRAAREDGAHDLCAVVLLRGAHLQAVRPVDAEAGAVLRGPVERRGGLQSAVDRLLVGPDALDARGRRARLREVEGTGPAGREKWASGTDRKGLAEEVVPPPLPGACLLLDERTQVVHVGGAHVWGHEEVAVLAPVRQARIEQRLQEVLVLLLEERSLFARDI